MRTLFLSLMFLVGISFTGMQTTATASNGCTNCWDYADGAAGANGDWFEAHAYCVENLNPCNMQIILDPVIIKG